MSNYEAIYNAARQAFDISHNITMLQQEFTFSAMDMRKPSVLYRPALTIDGDKWCALYGENLQDGVAGFGNSPYEAMSDFDKNWESKLK